MLDALDLPASRTRAALLILASIFFVAAGANHFRDPDFYIAIMPPYLPAHGFLVALSGVFEIAGGVGLLIPRIRRMAGWMLVLLLVAVLPANIHMAVNPEAYESIPRVALWARLPFQAVFIAWVLWASREADSARGV